MFRAGIDIPRHVLPLEPVPKPIQRQVSSSDIAESGILAESAIIYLERLCREYELLTTVRVEEN